MNRFRAIRRDERGATAIEYAVIAALIGIGIIGSLVTTRTSLNSIFGVASSQMGSVNGGASSGNRVTSQRAVAAASTSSRYPFWSAKTLQSKVVTNPSATTQLTQFTYTDGTIGSYLTTFDSAGNLVSETVTTYPWGDSGRTNDSAQATYAADGTPTSLLYTARYANGTTMQTATSTVANFTTELLTNYNTTGGVTSTQNYSDPNMPANLAKLVGDEVYFRALSQ